MFNFYFLFVIEVRYTYQKAPTKLEMDCQEDTDPLLGLLLKASMLGNTLGYHILFKKEPLQNRKKHSLYVNYCGVTTKGRRGLKGLFLAPVEGKLEGRALAGCHPPGCHTPPGPGKGQAGDFGDPCKREVSDKG